MLSRPKFWIVLMIIAYGFVWAFFTGTFLARQNFDALFLLTLVTLPASLFVSAIAHSLSLGNDGKTIFELAGFLILGSAEYAFLGYVVGISIRWLTRRFSGRLLS